MPKIYGGFTSLTLHAFFNMFVFVFLFCLFSSRSVSTFLLPILSIFLLSFWPYLLFVCLLACMTMTRSLSLLCIFHFPGFLLFLIHLSRLFWFLLCKCYFLNSMCYYRNHRLLFIHTSSRILSLSCSLFCSACSHHYRNLGFFFYRNLLFMYWCQHTLCVADY